VPDDCRFRTVTGDLLSGTFLEDLEQDWRWDNSVTLIFMPLTLKGNEISWVSPVFRQIFLEWLTCLCAELSRSLIQSFRQRHKMKAGMLGFSPAFSNFVSPSKDQCFLAKAVSKYLL
jgi:hypothetical protein